MKSIDVTKEKREVRECRQKYLAAGKHYSQLLLSAAKLDSNILYIAQEIQGLGNNISALDSKAITDFYNSVKEKSKIDPAYHDIAHEIIKAKHALDHIRYQLFHKELELSLKSVGLPVRKHNLEVGELAKIINNPDEKLLAKIAYATPYIKEELLELAKLIEKGDVDIEPGEISGKTKTGKSFLKELNRKIVQRVNDVHFGKKEFDIKKIYINHKTGSANPLDLIRNVGDSDHLRELERRISAGDVTVTDSNICAITDRGRRYLRLLFEELDGVLEKNMDQHILTKNTKSLENENILDNIAQIISDYENRLSAHTRITSGFDARANYHDLVGQYQNNILELAKSRDEIFSDIERISNAALGVRKKLLVLSSLDQIKVGETIPLVSAYRLLANYETQLDRKIESLSSKLKVRDHVSNVMVPSITDIRDVSINTDMYYQKADRDIEGVIPNRVKLKSELDTILDGFMKNLPEYQEYREVVVEQSSLKDYLIDYIEKEDRLYRGNEIISTLVSEIVELEVRREELLSKITHEVQLAHKRTWLTSIRKDNEDYFVSTFGGNDKLNDRAVSLNSQIITQIEGDISALIGNIKDSHQKHTEEFLLALGTLVKRVENGEDISMATAEISKKYLKMDKSNRELLVRLNKEMSKLDRQLVDLPIKSRKAIEKNLILDIKNQVGK